MTRRGLRTVSAVLFLASMLSTLNASGADAFSPNQFIGAGSPFYSYSASLNFDTSQSDRYVTIKSYRVDLPAGWHIAHGSIDPSTQLTCDGLTAANTETSAERIGYTQLTLHNDDTRGRSGAVPFSGFLYLLNSDTTTATATLCSRMTTSSSLIPAANREVMFQILLKYDTTTGGSLTWSYATVPGAVPGSRAIFDSPYYSSKNTSILYTRIELNTLTKGNYHTDLAGKKTAVRFVWNPSTPGNYSFIGTYTPCGVGDPGNCSSSATPAVRTTVVRITNYPTGFHPGPTVTSPALWSVLRGTAPVSVKWRQPTTLSSSDPIKGYIVTVSADYVADSTKTFYFITNTNSPSFTPEGPCGSDGALAECAFGLTLPYTSDASKLVSADNNFTLTMVTLFEDGHRSDGNCDDGSGTGTPPPCADGTVPAFVASGTARTQFMHREYAWPLAYRKIINNNSPAKWPGVWQVYVLLADLDKNKMQYVEWKPVGATYAANGTTISGANSTGGVISFTQMSGATHWMLHAVLGPTDARGVWVRMSSSNQIQNADRFDGCSFFGTPIPRLGAPFPDLTGLGSLPCPTTASAMSKI